MLVEVGDPPGIIAADDLPGVIDPERRRVGGTGYIDRHEGQSRSDPIETEGASMPLVIASCPCN